MRRKNLVGLLSGIVSSVIAGSVATAGCGAQESSAGGPSFDAGAPPDSAEDADADADDASLPPPLPDEATFHCSEPLPDVLSTLHPAVPVDYVELRTHTYPSNDRDAGVTTTTATVGTPCATATDRDACRQALDEHQAETGQGWELSDWSIGSVEQFLIYTRGDEVGSVVTPAQLVAFLGKIDTLEEARLLLSTEREHFHCTTAPFKSGWRPNADGSWDMLVTGSDCGNPYQVRMHISAEGVVTRGEMRRIDTGSVCGRRPEGLVTGEAVQDGATVSLAAWLAEAAQLEAASVIAFRRLESELGALAAPRRLVIAARRARADEIRHAREMSLLAHRFGATIPRVEIAPLASRTPFRIALENAVEGCVRETYGALVAEYQARTASDPELRSVLRRIARDEAQHAALAHDVARWLEPQLDDDERAAIARARADALADLRAAVLRPPAEEVATLAGMPRPREALALLAAMDHAGLSRAA